ncbi:oxidoreductase domain protein [Beutenbergia cavernae DSM 12333]|uniref:Oxidoreductase domain protein n=1 Tax=Beutenbergia cavernae (strain ATCC BAA-8 / DSM 12333 / CCUG 43141 / JCM 11478 / NBRC 16432 / NCIMB 13614 / HKI 0122) TaxID=471853 RepID=C5C3V5_BEUC1|nr:Gfo/Idh/MocA family oxidoreductase [Beutenbergia cavernae]ACQ82014.1 oxidoreductase domain protein [Beutenbergia cavernae DSM 12333]
MSEVRYGVVGTGYFGGEIARYLSGLGGARVVAVHDPEFAEPVAQEVGARVVPSVEELCQDAEVDVVIVASPNWAHRDAVLAAARAGKPVFSEKPIALSYADCAAMIDATARAGVLFMAGHVMNFMAGVRHAKRLIGEGAIGDVLFCRAIRNGWEEPQESVSWKKRRDLSGGHLYHHIHELDLVQSIMGSPETVTMAGGNVAHDGPQFGDEDDLLLITLEFPGQRFAALEYGSAFRWPEHYVLIQGTLGAIRIDLQDTGVELRTPGGSQRFLLHRSEEEDADRTAIYRGSSTDGAIQYGNPHRRPPMWLRGIIEEELTYFHGLVQGADALPEFAALTDGSAATASIATADALTRSLREGRKVAVAEVTAVVVGSNA